MGEAALKLEVEQEPNLRAQFAERITAAWHKSREKIFALGNALIEAKKALPHGDFEAMIAKDLPFTADHARRFMRIAADPRLSNPTSMSELPDGVAAMDKLRRLSDEQFEAGIATGQIHRNMTVKDAVELVQTLSHQNYLAHRPQAAQTRPATAPADGIARCYLELVWMLREERKRLGLTHEDVDHISGMEHGYAGKLEQPDALYGRRAVNPSFDLWLGGLGCGLVVVPKGYRVELVPV